MKLKPIITIITLGAIACVAMVMKQDQIAATAVGAIAAWGFLNGVKNELKKKEDTG